MRTSLNEIKEIDTYLQGEMSVGDRLVFDARMLLHKELRKNVALQRRIRALIELHHRATLKHQFQLFHKHLFHNPANAALKKEITNLFKS